VTTPALPVYHALHHQLRRIDTTGLEPRFARHTAMAALLHTWVEAHPAVSLLAGAGHRSPTVSALRLPKGRTAPEVVAEMEQRGWLIATGLAPLTDQVIRIGHMGDLEPVHLEGLLADLDAVLA
jgi:aspartate aminotransferase-like enzyme